MYSQALEATEYEEGTLRNDKFISGKFELSRRRENLSHSHHAEVASLEPEEVCGKRGKQLGNIRQRS